jgi:hypothetical protein
VRPGGACLIIPTVSAATWVYDFGVACTSILRVNRLSMTSRRLYNHRRHRRVFIVEQGEQNRFHHVALHSFDAGQYDQSRQKRCRPLSDTTVNAGRPRHWLEQFIHRDIGFVIGKCLESGKQLTRDKLLAGTRDQPVINEKRRSLLSEPSRAQFLFPKTLSQNPANVFRKPSRHWRRFPAVSGRQRF